MVRRAFNINFSIPGHQISRIGLQFFGHEFEYLILNRERCQFGGIAGPDRHAAAECAGIQRRNPGVGCRDPNVIDTHAQFFGHNLTDHGFRTLSDVGRARQHIDGAVPAQLDDRAGTDVAHIANAAGK